MWRKQGDPKPSPSPELAAPSAPEPAERSHPSEPRSPAPELTRITRAIAIKGELTGREDLYLDGQFEGAIRLTDAALTVGPNGRLAAEIEAREIHVHGAVEGNLVARERVHIGRTGSVAGEVVTHRIAIEEGAVFRGRVDIVRPGEARVPASAPPEQKAFRAVAAGAKDVVQ